MRNWPTLRYAAVLGCRAHVPIDLFVSMQDEITNLQYYLSTQPPPSVTDPVSLPPALVSVLLPHIRDHASSASGSVTAALTQRCKTLQEENDELYELLKSGETGKLKEDVRALRRVVHKLEGALKGACTDMAWWRNY